MNVFEIANLIILFTALAGLLAMLFDNTELFLVLYTTASIGQFVMMVTQFMIWMIKPYQ